MSELKHHISIATAWLGERASELQFGEVGVVLVLHAGKIARMETSVTRKFLPEEEPRYESRK